MKKFIFFLLGMFLYTSVDAQDYYRSVANGEWSTSSTWQQSPDNVTWVAATTIPDETATSITIRSPNTVTIATPASAKTLIIENGAVLQQNAGLTIFNGLQAYDFIITGMLVVTVAIPSLNTGARILVSENTGYVRIDVNVSGNSMFARNTSIVFEHGATFDWNDNLAFGTSEAVYFPNTAENIVPIFKISKNMSIGSGSSTIINGLLVANANVSWTNEGTKTFRNGISGTGTVTQTGTGAFVINGTTSTLGGTGTVALNSSGGLSVSSSLCRLESDKDITDGRVIVENGSVFDAGTHTISGPGSFTLKAGTTLISASPQGVDGSITCTGVNVFEPLSNYTFNGEEAQVTGTLMSNTVGKLMLENTGVISDEQVTLSQTTQVNNLTLSDGILNTKTSTLTISESGTITGGSIESYVYGPLRRTTSAAVPRTYHFPLGDITGMTNVYRPIRIETVTNGGDVFTAEYFRAPPLPTSGSTFLETTLTGLGNDEYWNIQKSGTEGSTARVIIPYIVPTSWRDVSYQSITPCGACVVAIAKRKDNNWDFTTTIPAQENTPPLQKLWTESGEIASEVLNEFADFAVGFSYDEILPVSRVVLTEQEGVLLWETYTSTPIARYRVEYAKEGRWNTEMETHSTTHKPKHENAFYRVRVLSNTGQEVLSNQVFISETRTGTLSVFPNPLTRHSFLSVQSEAQQRATISSLEGKVWWSDALKKGVTTIPSSFPSGIYFLSTETYVLKFIVF